MCNDWSFLSSRLVGCSSTLRHLCVETADRREATDTTPSNLNPGLRFLMFLVARSLFVGMSVIIACSG